MIIGNGMLATLFRPHFENINSVIIFASGVANSNCRDREEFLREKLLLLSTINSCAHDQLLVYFSTCSILNSQPMAIPPYVKHKLEMEKLASNAPNYLIIRLPQIAGPSSNPHTLLNFLHRNIQSSTPFEAWTLAKRNILDGADLAQIIQFIIEKKLFSNSVVNIASPQNHTVIEIIEHFEKILNKKAIYSINSIASDLAINIEWLKKVFEELGMKFDSDYLQKTLVKYYRSNENLIPAKI